MISKVEYSVSSIGSKGWTALSAIFGQFVNSVHRGQLKSVSTVKRLQKCVKNVSDDFSATNSPLDRLLVGRRAVIAVRTL